MSKQEAALAGQVLKNLRIEYGKSQQVVANEVTEGQGPSLCVRHYRRIEKGQMIPSVLLALSICSVLDTDVYEVWG